MSAKSYLRADSYASLASDHHRLPRRERKREFTVPDFSSSRRRDGVNGDVRKPDSRYPRPICGEFPDLARVSMTEGDGAFDGGARLNLESAIGSEQQRREDAKKELGDGKFGGGFGFTCQVKVSDFGQMSSIALFSAFASS